MFAKHLAKKSAAEKAAKKQQEKPMVYDQTLPAEVSLAAMNSTFSHTPSKGKGKKTHPGKCYSVVKTQTVVMTSNGVTHTMFWSSSESRTPTPSEKFASKSESKDVLSQWDTESEPPRELLRGMNSNDPAKREAVLSSIEEID